MKRTGRALIVALTALFLYSSQADALLRDFGPVNPATGFPVWYRDNGNLALEACLSTAISPNVPPAPDALGIPSTYMCNILPELPPDYTDPPGYNPTLPLNLNTNFPSELFWWVGEAGIDLAGGRKSLLVLALEGAFANGPAEPNQKASFARVRISIPSPPAAGTYRFTHPYGVETINVAQAGERIFFTRDIGLGAPGTFDGALNGNVGPFLVWTPDPAYQLTVNGEEYVGDPNIPHTVTGSPFGTNVFRIEGPAGVDLDPAPGVQEVIETDLFSITGKKYTTPIPSTMTVERATYIRDAGVASQIDVFATADKISNQGTASALAISDPAVAPALPAFAETALDGDGTGKFFKHLELAAGTSLPTTVTLTNTADSPVTVKTVALTDEVTITGAHYDPAAHTLRITALSSDRLAPPTLTAVGLGVLDSAGVLEITLPAPPPPDAVVPLPEVVVVSSAGGSDAEPISVLQNDATNVAPSAVNDPNMAATVNVTTILAVTANDSDANGNLAPATVAVTSGPVPVSAPLAAIASATVNADGTINFVADSLGSYSFTYTVSDTLGVVSAPATVTVTVSAVNNPPAAVSDAATTAEDTSVDIDVLANDTDPENNIDLLSPAVAAQPANGTVTVSPLPNAFGRSYLVYTPKPNFNGIDTFTYRVTDTAGTFATGTATVTVTPVNDPPLANPDLESASSGATKVISVLTNDNDPDGTIALNSVTVTPPSAGTATANADGTVTYVSPAGFTGTATFTYTVLDNLGAPSNSATVTVNVVAANEAITVTKAQFETAKGYWRIIGATNVFGLAVTNAMTVYIGKTTTGTVLGTADVAVDGTWRLEVGPGSPLVPDASRTVSVKSAGGAERPAVPLAVR